MERNKEGDREEERIGRRRKRLEAGRLFGTFPGGRQDGPTPHPTVSLSCSVPLFLSQVKTWPPRYISQE